MKLPDHYVPKYFKGYEVVPPEVYDRWGEKAMYLYVDIRVLITLDQIREFFNTPVDLNNWYWLRQKNAPTIDWKMYRGYRPDTYYLSEPFNASQHRFGRAADPHIRGVKGHEARDIIMNHQDRFPFIRRIEDNVKHVHFDVMNTSHHGIHLFYP